MKLGENEAWKREGERSANDNPAFCIYIIGSETENNRTLP